MRQPFQQHQLQDNRSLAAGFSTQPQPTMTRPIPPDLQRCNHSSPPRPNILWYYSSPVDSPVASDMLVGPQSCQWIFRLAISIAPTRPLTCGSTCVSLRVSLKSQMTAYIAFHSIWVRKTPPEPLLSLTAFPETNHTNSIMHVHTVYHCGTRLVRSTHPATAPNKYQCIQLTR